MTTIVSIFLALCLICFLTIIFKIIPNAAEVADDNEAIYKDSIEDSDETLFM